MDLLLSILDMYESTSTETTGERNQENCPSEKRLDNSFHGECFCSVFMRNKEKQDRTTTTALFVYSTLIYITCTSSLARRRCLDRFSMLPIPCNGNSLAVSHWKLWIVLMVGYRSSRLSQNKPFSGPTLPDRLYCPLQRNFTVSACPVAYAPLDILPV